MLYVRGMSRKTQGGTQEHVEKDDKSPETELKIALSTNGQQKGNRKERISEEIKFPEKNPKYFFEIFFKK